MTPESAGTPSRLLIKRLKPKFLLLTAGLLALVFLAIILIGIRENQNNMLKMLRKEGEALMEAIFIASQNAIRAGDLVSDLVSDNLVDLARVVDLDLGRGLPSAERLDQLCRQLGVNRIDVLDSAGAIAASNYSDLAGQAYDSAFVERFPLEDILKGTVAYSTFLEEGDALTSTEQLVAVVGTENAPGAIAVFINYQKLDNFSRQIGIGYMIRNIGSQPGIDYIFLQSQEGVALSSRQLPPVPAIESDSFLAGLLQGDQGAGRRLTFEGVPVLELCRPFKAAGLPTGVLRLGLSLRSYQQVAWNFKIQMAVLGVILFLLSFLLVTMVMANQSFRSTEVAYEQFKAMTENLLGRIESAAVAVDAQRRVALLNPRTERLFGVTAGRCLGHPYKEVFPGDTFRIDALLDSAQESLVQEIDFVDSAGRQHILLVTASLLGRREGNLEGAVGLVLDLTEARSRERQVKQAERLSELGTLAAAVAHEIRNPLNAISIASQRLKSEFEVTQDREGFARLATTIKQEIDRLNTIIEQFLALARSSSSRKVPTNLHEFIGETVALFEHEAARQNVRIETGLESGLVLKLDRAEMKKVFANLLKNALEAIGSNGTVRISAERRGQSIAIAIEDSGPGILLADREKLFVPYFTTKPGGTGLGLAIAHRIVRDHDGTLAVENIQPHGARFTITLPPAESVA